MIEATPSAFSPEKLSAAHSINHGNWIGWVAAAAPRNVAIGAHENEWLLVNIGSLGLVNCHDLQWDITCPSGLSDPGASGERAR
jgi:hypothetical protein